MILESAEQDPSIPSIAQAKPCPQHPNADMEMGYGLAGGGFGSYVLCAECARILGKDQDTQYDDEGDSDGNA